MEKSANFAFSLLNKICKKKPAKNFSDIIWVNIHRVFFIVGICYVWKNGIFMIKYILTIQNVWASAVQCLRDIFAMFLQYIMQLLHNYRADVVQTLHKCYILYIYFTIISHIITKSCISMVLWHCGKLIKSR
jgi:hypothetical protein